MNYIRLFRVQRKQIFCLFAIITFILIYVQFLSYKLLTTVGSSASNRENQKCPFGNIEPIDVVYTWVNGSDEEFQKLLTHHTIVDGDKAGKMVMQSVKFESYSSERFDDKDELKYSLRSIEKHMPWARHVYIVTNGQIPSWLDMDYEKVTIVTHAEIFSYIEDLPTFSSPAIEANLHRIPGLSEKFIYFNDDIFLNAEVHPEDFYTNNEGYKIYPAWLTPNCANNCTWEMLNDGKCDMECYNKYCDFDIDDCVDLVPALTTKSSSEKKKIAAAHRFLNLARTVSNDNNEEINMLLDAKIKQYNDERIKELKLIKQAKRQKENENQVVFGTSEDSRHINKTNLDFDMFSASLLFTQKLLGYKFGFQQRWVIAHAPIMFDKRIMQEVQDQFRAEFRNTMNHKFRHETNVQISLLYSYYLSSSWVEKSMSDIFDEYDTDQSGTWSDREIRTLLSRLNPLPLTYEMLTELENALINCTNLLTAHELAKERRRTTPKYERYVDSPLNVITKKMIVGCSDLKMRFRNFPDIRRRNKYKWQMLYYNRDVSFNMLQSHVALAMNLLDTIRKESKKFVCINDDLVRSNLTRADNELVVTLLADFFESLFPKRSKYELLPSYRNRFAYIKDLRLWRQWHWNVASNSHGTIFVVICVSIVIVCLVFYFAFCCCLALHRPSHWFRFRRIAEAKFQWFP